MHSPNNAEVQYRTINILTAYFPLNSCFPLCLHAQKFPFNRHQYKFVSDLHLQNQEERAIRTLCVVLLRYLLSEWYLVSEDTLFESRKKNRTP